MLEEPLVFNGYYQSKVIVTRIVPSIRLDPPTSLPSTAVSSPTDSRREDGAAVREVRSVLALGISR